MEWNSNFGVFQCNFLISELWCANTDLNLNLDSNKDDVVRNECLVCVGPCGLAPLGYLNSPSREIAEIKIRS